MLKDYRQIEADLYDSIMEQKNTDRMNSLKLAIDEIAELELRTSKLKYFITESKSGNWIGLVKEYTGKIEADEESYLL